MYCLKPHKRQITDEQVSQPRLWYLSTVPSRDGHTGLQPDRAKTLTGVLGCGQQAPTQSGGWVLMQPIKQ